MVIFITRDFSESCKDFESNQLQKLRYIALFASYELILNFGCNCIIESLIFFRVNIFRDTLMPIACYPDSVCWRARNRREIVILPEIWRICTIFFFNIAESGYLCRIDSFILFFSGWRLVKIHQYPFLVTQIQCFGDNKIVGKWH